MDFTHEVRLSAGIGPAHFPAAFGMLLSQHSKEGAPFMGTALAEYKQCIEPRSSAIFTFLLKFVFSFEHELSHELATNFHELYFVCSCENVLLSVKMASSLGSIPET